MPESSDVSSGDSALATDYNDLRTDALKLWAQGNTVLTISGGSITLGVNGFYAINTQGNASTDNLDTINGGEVGEIILISASNAARTVVVRDGVGNIQLIGGRSLPLVDAEQMIMLRYNGTNWIEVSGGGDRIMTYGYNLGNVGSGAVASGVYGDHPNLPRHYILGYYARANVSGSISIDLRLTTLTDVTINATNSVGTSPVIVFTSDLTQSDTGLTGWTREQAADRLARFIVTAAATSIEQVAVNILAVKL